MLNTSAHCATAYHSIHSSVVRFAQSELSYIVFGIAISNPPLLGPFLKVETFLIWFQSGRIQTEIAHAMLLIPALSLQHPGLLLLPLNLYLLHLSLASNREAPDPASATEEPVRILDVALIIFETARGKVQRAEEHEVTGRIDEAHMEEGHLGAGGAIALVDTDARV